jgi:hypothetical protein
MKKEEFIEHTLKSLEGIKPAKANDFLYTRVMAGIEKTESTGSFFTNPKFAISSLAVLLVLNVFFLLRENKTENKPVNLASQIQTEYFSYTNYNY